MKSKCSNWFQKFYHSRNGKERADVIDVMEEDCLNLIINLAGRTKKEDTKDIP
jgi:hypothetical protein